MNKVTRADVEVQPYVRRPRAFRRAHRLQVRWQVLDTPGILDRPLEERNTIEMQSITAMAHLRAVVLYIVDASEQCGSIKQQSDLFHPSSRSSPQQAARGRRQQDGRQETRGPGARGRGPDPGDARGDARRAERPCAWGRARTRRMTCRRCRRSTRRGGGRQARVLAINSPRREGGAEARVAARGRGPEPATRRAAETEGRGRATRGDPAPVALNRAKKASGELQVVTEKDLQERNGGAGVYSEPTCARGT